jgi:hypothetical protein
VEELYSRAALAQNDAELAYQTPEGRAAIDELLSTPGISAGGIVAFYLDPERSLPELIKATETAQVATAASRAQFSLTVDESVALRNAGIDPQSVQSRAASLTNAGDVRFGVGGDLEALSREQEVGFLAGQPNQAAVLNRRAQQLQARFGGGGSFLRRQDGATVGLGSA